MKVQTHRQKCIICCRKPADTWEHILPESIGGRLQAKILCSTCNSEVGSEIEADIKSNASIRLAIEHLKTELPDLYREMQERQRFIGKDSQGRKVEMYCKKGKIRVCAKTLDDGSLIQDTDKARGDLQRMLRKKGIDEPKISRVLEEFDTLPEDQCVELPYGLVLAKWSIGSVQPDLTSPSIDNRVPLLIAYEFLSLVLEPVIFSEKLSSIRETIQGKQWPSFCRIDHLTTRKYAPEHSLYMKTGKREATIFIRLFGWLVYAVHIQVRGFDYLGHIPVYFENLQNKRSLVVRSLEMARRGLFHAFK
jgi:hypothetical protein